MLRISKDINVTSKVEAKLLHEQNYHFVCKGSNLNMCIFLVLRPWKLSDSLLERTTKCIIMGGGGGINIYSLSCSSQKRYISKLRA